MRGIPARYFLSPAYLLSQPSNFPRAFSATAYRSRDAVSSDLSPPRSSPGAVEDFDTSGVPRFGR